MKFQLSKTKQKKMNKQTNKKTKLTKKPPQNTKQKVTCNMEDFCISDLVSKR